MSVELVIGPMFSGKTTTLLTYEKKFQITGKKYLCINHSFDTRYNKEGKLATHDGKVSSGKHITVSELNQIEHYILHTYDAFIIDEVQFFKGIDEFVNFWSSKGKNIVCAGLNSDYKLEQFEPVSKLIPKCDNIHHLKALCVECGGEASFTERCVENKEQTLVGTGDIYKPKCRKHHTVVK